MKYEINSFVYYHGGTKYQVSDYNKKNNTYTLKSLIFDEKYLNDIPENEIHDRDIRTEEEKAKSRQKVVEYLKAFN